ncbi:hypothetical protein U1Q18_008269 [Sarracenia purpurea var. burkii]
MEARESKMKTKTTKEDEKGHKRVENVEELIINAPNIDTVKYVEKKLADKGVQRMERHPADGLPFARPPPKSGHGGKYTWEGPAEEAENELDPAPPAIDEKDPNYVDDEEETAAPKEEEVGELVVGQVEAAEVREGVARIEVDPRLSA